MGGEPVGGLVVQLQQTAPIPLAAEFSCAAGELLALVGPSGSGKTTILRCIAGLARPRSGRISCDPTLWLDTAVAVDLPPQQRRIGYVFQHYALFPHFSALDNIAAALAHVPPAERRTRASELLALVHLKGLESRRPSELSGGQQQRVALARALARDPSVLLLDEPFAAVDQVTRRKLQRELARLRHRMSMPIILVTHDLEEARMLADRMCILHRGETLQVGTPEQVLTRPQDAQVARMVNLSNVFRGRIVAQEPAAGVTRVRWRGHTLECRHDPAFEAGETVDWVVPQRYVILHQRVRPSLGERENPVAGVVDELLVLGENANVTMMVGERTEDPLSFTVPVHVAQRNRLVAGESISVTLLAEGIHLMKPCRDRSDGR